MNKLLCTDRCPPVGVPAVADTWCHLHLGCDVGATWTPIVGLHVEEQEEQQQEDEEERSKRGRKSNNFNLKGGQQSRGSGEG